MYSIQLQTTELGEPEHGMHTSTSSIKHLSNFKLLFLKVVFCTRVGFKNYNMAMISYFNKHSLPGKCLKHLKEDASRSISYFIALGCWYRDEGVFQVIQHEQRLANLLSNCGGRTIKGYTNLIWFTEQVR